MAAAGTRALLGSTHSPVRINAAFSPARGHVDNSQLWAVDSPHLLHPFGQHVGAGCAEVDVEHDDTDHHDYGHQHHAEEQEPAGHMQPGAPGVWWGVAGQCGRGVGVAWAWRGVGGAGRAVTHLPMRGMARDVAGSLLEMSSRKTDCARSTEMAIDVFSPPGGVWT